MYKTELTPDELELLKTFIAKGGQLFYGIRRLKPSTINIEVVGIVDVKMLDVLQKTSYMQYLKAKRK